MAARRDGATVHLSRMTGSIYGGVMDERRAEDQPVEADNPTGGDETTEDQLEADNPVEEDTLKTLEPDSPPA